MDKRHIAISVVYDASRGQQSSRWLVHSGGDNNLGVEEPVKPVVDRTLLRVNIKCLHLHTRDGVGLSI